jgi:hypothetical protein
MSSSATENGNLRAEVEGRDTKAIIKNVDSKSDIPSRPIVYQADVPLSPDPATLLLSPTSNFKPQ